MKALEQSGVRIGVSTHEFLLFGLLSKNGYKYPFIPCLVCVGLKVRNSIH